MNYINISKKVLTLYDNNKNRNLKLLLKNELIKAESKENAKISNIVYGVVRKDRILEFYIKQLSKIKIDKIENDTLFLLKIGLYLIFYSSGTPEYAIVNELVNHSNKRSKNFINAILRNSIRKKTELLSKIEKSNHRIKYSISETLIESTTFLNKNPEIFLKYFNTEPVFHLRENFIRTDIGVEKDKELFLKELNIIKPLNTYELLKPEKIINNFIKSGSLYIQNTGSQIISIIASKYAKKNLLDYCAAPGIKSITLENLSPNLNIFANDINFNRLNLFKRNKKTNIHLIVSDILNRSFKDQFDFILIDAPCSSSGTLRKNPDLKTKINKDLIKKNSDIQKSILESVFKGFSSDYILYSVCSFIKEETEDIIKNSNKENRYNIIDLSTILKKYNFKFKKGKYGCFLLPSYTLNNDLFYISLLKLRLSN